MSFLSIFASINSPLFLLCVCPFTVNYNTNRLHTDYGHIFYIALVVLAYETVLWFVMYSELSTFQFANYSMSELLLNLSALSMVFSFLINIFASLQSRLAQMDIIHGLVNLDKHYPDDQFEIDVACQKSCQKFRRQLVIIAVYKMVSLLGTIIFVANTVSRSLFFVCYSISDGIFTVYINYIAFCGQMVILRYEIFIKRFQTILKGFTINPNQYVDLLHNLNALFAMKERLYRAFGSMILYTIFYHSLTMAVAVYAIIITLNRLDDFLIICIMLFLYFLWTLPYFGRVYVLGHVYDAFGLQVIYSIRWPST